MTDGTGNRGGLPEATRGILWMLLAALVFSGTDALSKLLAATYPVAQVTWFRLAFHLLLMAVLLNRRLPAVMASAVPRRQLVRSGLLLAAMALLTLALRELPLADLTAMMQTTPLLVTLLAMLLLGEKVGRRRLTGVVAGLCGALIIVRPGLGVWQWTALLPISASLCFAAYQVMTRMVSRDDGPLTSMLWTPLAGTLVLGLAMPWTWQAPDATGWLLLGSLGILGGASQYFLIKSVTAAPASVVSPYLYSGLIWGVALGYLIFGDFPDAWTFVGAGVIVGAGLYVYRRERLSEGAPD